MNHITQQKRKKKEKKQIWEIPMTKTDLKQYLQI